MVSTFSFHHNIELIGKSEPILEKDCNINSKLYIKLTCFVKFLLNIMNGRFLCHLENGEND